MKVFNLAVVVASVVFAVAAQQAPAAALVTTYTQNFDSMGTSGTTPPTDWSMKVGEGGANSTWTTSITANGGSLSVASMINTTGALTAIATPANTNNNGYNAAAVPGSDSSNRVLSTSPTGITGDAIQLTLTNDTGGPLNSMSVGYDIDRFTSVTAENQLPGYQLFYSLDTGSTWTNVAALNPTVSGLTGVIVPNTVGITTVPLTGFSLSSSWNDRSTLLLRWVDDNAQETSPDQIIGLDNVTVSTVPEPATVGMIALAAVAVIQRRHRSA